MSADARSPLTADALLAGRTYELTRDVENKELDRRVKWDVRVAAWRKGDRWRCERAFVAMGEISVAQVQLKAVRVACSNSRSGSIYLHSHESADELVAALELLPESAADVLERIGLSLSYHTGVFAGVIGELMRTGKLTEADLQAAWQSWSDREDD